MGTRIKLRQWGVIVLAWLFFSIVISFYDHLTLYTYYSLGTQPDYTFWASMLRNMIPGFIGAILGGFLLVFYVNEKYRNKPYLYSIVMVGVSFILIVLLITVVMEVFIVPKQLGGSLANHEPQKKVFGFIANTFPLKNGLVWLFVVMVTQVLLQMSYKFSPQLFWPIIRGEYHTPKVEQKIFMFLDLDDSTAIAEKLGNEQYHNLLRDFFSDITPAILQTNGNIYQYVGDEAVVSWDIKKGIEKANCIHCFFKIKSAIYNKKKTYYKKYRLAPTFKAGIHCGEVVAGEVGIIKRDITYSGDVLNTTSRILSKCKALKEDVIVSDDLLRLLNNTANYQTAKLGDVQFKGKEELVSIHSILLNEKKH